MTGFWIYMLIIVLLIPIVMIAFGSRFINHPPRKINWVFGYRTAQSMKNQETWNFAHRYFGVLWRRLGWIILPPSVIAMLFLLGKSTAVIGGFSCLVVVVQMVPMIVPLVFVERALKQEFDDNGRRRKNTAYNDKIKKK